MDGFLQDTILFVAVIMLAGWILYLLFKRHQLTAQAKLKRIEAYNKLLEKFTTAKEFADFLDSEQGKRLLEDPLPNGNNPKKIALRFIQGGILLGALGAGLLMNLSRISNIVNSQTNPDINWVNKELDFFYWTWIVSAMAGGCVLVGLLTLSLGKKWKLIPEDAKRST